MDAFAPIPPKWTDKATHAYDFCCPQCHATSHQAVAVWINRRSPVFTENRRRKWQEFYHCECGYIWWAWSNERPPVDILNQKDDYLT
jgi:hypothetical protein